MKFMTKFFLIMLIPILIASLWDSVPVIKTVVHAVLDPTFGFLLGWNLIIGFIIVTGIITLLSSLIQKFFTDQEALKQIKKEQKILQEEMKKYKDNPAKLLEFQKKQFEFLPKTMDLTMKPLIYTMIPFVLLFRWFNLYFVPIWGGWWILYYIIASMIFSSIFRKILKLA